MIILSEETKFQIETPFLGFWKDSWVLWRESVHAQSGRLGLVVLAGARVVFEPFLVTDTDAGIITIGAGLPKISNDGLNVLVKFRSISDSHLIKGMTEEILLNHHISCFSPDKPWIDLEIPLGSIAGKNGSFVLECHPGPQNDPTADHLAIYEFVISPKESLRLNRARAFMARRILNERKYFTAIYEHPMYNDSTVSEPTEHECKTVPSVSDPPVSVYGHAMELLNNRLDTIPPNFHDRLRNKVLCQAKTTAGNKRKLKIFSLCSGAARIEIDLIRQLPVGSVELTISDINADLLEGAKRKLSCFCEVNVLKCDINAITTGDTGEMNFDIIMCVSALHHIVELERLMEFVHCSLVDEGEFWVIGEYVGKNGNRLWPEAYTIANSFFKDLPEKYRLNKVSSANPHVDISLPDTDCSINVFEGIRSEDIEACLGRFFTPLSVHKYCCFLWRLFDLAYCDNYDLTCAGDLKIIQNAIDLELSHYYCGGRPTTLNGIYTKKNNDIF